MNVFLRLLDVAKYEKEENNFPKICDCILVVAEANYSGGTIILWLVNYTEEMPVVFMNLNTDIYQFINT